MKGLFRGFLFVCGFTIFLTLAPHDSPWALSSFSRTVSDGVVSTIVSPTFIPGLTFIVPSKMLGGIVLALMALVVLALPLGLLRQAWGSLRKSNKAFTGGLIAVYFFIITLIPAELDFIRDGTVVIFYLLVSSIAIALMMIGSAPAASAVVTRFSGSLSAVYDQWKRRFLLTNATVFLAIAVIINFLFTNALSYFVFEHLPHIQDSIAQYFHGLIFTKGALVAPPVPLPEFFNFTHVITNERGWYSQYPPGHSVLLAAGLLFNAPWIINPLFGSLTIIPAYALARELYDETTARLTALLMVLSPFLLFMSSEYMNHTTALFFFAIFLLFLVKSLRSGSAFHGLISGGALGWLACIRPYSAPALAAPFLLYAAWQIFTRRPSLFRTAAGFSAGLAFFIGLLLAFNWLTNGHPLLFGFEVLWGEEVRPGFGKSAWGENHTPMRGLLHTLSNFNGMNKYLFELPIPSLLLALPIFFTTRHNKWDYLMVLAFLSLAFAYFFYWFQDWCFGPRFLYEASVPVILLVARSIQHLPEMWNSSFGLLTERFRVRIYSIALLVFLFVSGFASNVTAHIQFYSLEYWGVNDDVVVAVEKAGITRGLIFVKSYYGGVFIHNDPFLKSDIVYAIDRGNDNHLLIKYFPHLPTYRATGSFIEPITVP